MPALKNPRHEAFCQAFVKGKTVGNAAASYKAAGFKGDRREASKLRHVPDVARRIGELSAKAAEIAEKANERAVEARAITVDSLIEEFDGLKAAALKFKQIGPAVQALTAKAKMAGLWIERAEQRNPDLTEAVSAFVDKPPAETYEQWQDRRKRELAGRG